MPDYFAQDMEETEQAIDWLYEERGKLYTKLKKFGEDKNYYEKRINEISAKIEKYERKLIKMEQQI